MKLGIKGFGERAERSRAGRYMDQQGNPPPSFCASLHPFPIQRCFSPPVLKGDMLLKTRNIKNTNKSPLQFSKQPVR